MPAIQWLMFCRPLCRLLDNIFRPVRDLSRARKPNFLFLFLCVIRSYVSRGPQSPAEALKARAPGSARGELGSTQRVDNRIRERNAVVVVVCDGRTRLKEETKE